MKKMGRIASAGILGLAGLLGCETDDGSSITIRDATPLVTLGAREGFGIAAQNSAAEGDIRRAQGYQAASNLAGTGAQWSHEERIADRGRGNVIVNNYGEYSSDRKPVSAAIYSKGASEYFFVCNGWDDFNLDGIVGYPSEIKGLKDHFLAGEDIEFLARVVNVERGDRFTLRIVDKNNSSISAGGTRISDRRGDVYFRWDYKGVGMPPGEYRVNFFSSLGQMYELDFTVGD